MKDEMAKADEKMLQSACDRWRKGKALIDEAMRTFEGYSITAHLTRWQFDDLVISYDAHKLQIEDMREKISTNGKN